jgi:hypothetical protein
VEDVLQYWVLEKSFPEGVRVPPTVKTKKTVKKKKKKEKKRKEKKKLYICMQYAVCSMQYAVPFIWKISKSIFRVNSICRFWSHLAYFISFIIIIYLLKF